MAATAHKGSATAGLVQACVLILVANIAVVSPHELLLPHEFRVAPQAYVQPAPPTTGPVFLRPGLDVGNPGLVLLAGRSSYPSVPGVLLLPQTSSSNVYHLSDTQHQLPPFLENVVNRVQNIFSSYVQVDPFHTPLGTPRPTTTVATDSNASTAAITTTTTTTTTARNIGLPRDVEPLDGRLRQAPYSSTQPVAFASATAQVQQVQQQGEGTAGDAVGGPWGGPRHPGGPSRPAVRPGPPPRGSSPGDASYYRKP